MSRETSKKRDPSHQKGRHPFWDLDGFMFKNCGFSSCPFLTKLTDLIKSNLEPEWPLWGSFDLAKRTFLQTKPDSHVSKLGKLEWDACILKFPNITEKSKTGSLLNTISRLRQRPKGF